MPKSPEKPYQPSPEEIRKAEEMLAPEEMLGSSIRETAVKIGEKHLSGKEEEAAKIIFERGKQDTSYVEGKFRGALEMILKESSGKLAKWQERIKNKENTRELTRELIEEQKIFLKESVGSALEQLRKDARNIDDLFNMTADFLIYAAEKLLDQDIDENQRKYLLAYIAEREANKQINIKNQNERLEQTEKNIDNYAENNLREALENLDKLYNVLG